jgi:acetyl-CoA carboxylase carboxyl transferase subunit alpha
MESEERGVAEAIAFNLREMTLIEVPIIVIVCGEGGSGGALGIAIGDRVLMQEFAVYSVIPPEGCAAILWRDSNRKVEAAAALKITAPDLQALGIIDEIVPEPNGGAHNDFEQACALLDAALTRALTAVAAESREQRLERRYRKFRQMGSDGQAFVDTARVTRKLGDSVSATVPAEAKPAAAMRAKPHLKDGA